MLISFVLAGQIMGVARAKTRFKKMPAENCGTFAKFNGRKVEQGRNEY